MTEQPDQPLRHRKIRDRALILPIVGLILVTPPVAGIFHLDSKIGGLPFTGVYLFTVWALLIAGAYMLSRQLGRAEAAGDDAQAGEAMDPPR